MTQKKARKTRTMRLPSLFLAAIIFASIPGISSYAGAARSNDAGNASAAQSNRSLPANPTHHCTMAGLEKDTATWSYICFGSYPQSEVTNAATMAAIDKAIAAGNGIKGAAGTDVLVKGTKYRRISTNDFVSDAADDAFRYFKWQPIKWKVLNNNEDVSLFVMAERAIDCAKYWDNDLPSVSTITWENSTIRSWLNDSFYQTAFSKEEQNAILKWNVINEDYPDCDAEGGNDTTDNVYLLSLREMTNALYGFCGNDSSSRSRQVQPSAYAYARGLSRINDPSFYENYDTCSGCCTWWLRTSGFRAGGYPGAVSVDEQGRLWETDNYSYETLGVAPVLHINPSSAHWSPTTAENANKKEVLNIQIDAPSGELAVGKPIKLKLKFTPKNAANKKVRWRTSNPKYATIDKNNRLKLKKAGAGKSVIITAIAADGSGSYGDYLICIMKHAVKRIKLSAPSTTVKAGDSVKIKATVKATGKKANKNLKWTSSNKKYATVTDSGMVNTKKAGKNKSVTITARATDGTNKKAKIKLTIE